MEFEYFLNVKGYELDSFGHVNNAVYLNYLEQARWEVVKETGTLGHFQKFKIVPAVIEVNIRYIREAKIFDELVVKTKYELGFPYVTFYQNIYDVNTKKKNCKATIKQLFIDFDRKPCDLDDEIKEIWENIQKQ